MSTPDDIRIGKLPPIAQDEPMPERAPPPGYEWKRLATSGHWCLFRLMTDEEERSIGRQSLRLDEEVDPAIREVIEREGARPSSLMAVHAMPRPDPLYEQLLLRALSIANKRTVDELGPLPLGGLPVQEKRRYTSRGETRQSGHDHGNGERDARNDTENEAMKWNHLAATAALVMGTATAHAEQPATVPSTPQTQIKAKADHEFYRPHTLTEYPDLTPEEMGQRVLKLVDSFKSKEDWNVEHIRKVTGLPVTTVKGQEGFIYSFLIEMPESGWGYGIDYSTNPQDNYPYTNVMLQFDNQVGEQHFDRADMAPVCGMDFQEYDTALRNMGFTPEPQYGEYGRLLSIDYTDPHRMAAWIRIRIRPESYDDEAKRGHSCVQLLMIRKPR